ncbi:Uricase (urate oxidase) [hydrothermal vent metagenome]|uniref:Uricase (Urate oxidase) n=1 Tax=hydrothermal vent metagenome TaxID=652676 RepID=A0A3B0R3I5_9ZZZZ
MPVNKKMNKRDLLGYGANPPHPQWPGGAKIAVQFVLNYEEGAENCVLNGDDRAETFLSEIIGAADVAAARHMSMESLYEYGARAGVWRVLRLFAKYDLPLTIFGVAKALQMNPLVTEAFIEAGHEICSHGLRWINYQYVDEATEREHMQQAIALQTKLTGTRPLGWYTGRTSPNTRRLLAQTGGFLYDSDDYSDDLPFWSNQENSPHLVVPYTLDSNDMRFASAQGFHTSEQFSRYLTDAFDVLYAEGQNAPKMLSIGLHGRIIGRPGRLAGLETFIKHVLQHQDVWVCQRVDIARHWRKTFPIAEQNQ